jgi:hypothetical protein
MQTVVQAQVALRVRRIVTSHCYLGIDLSGRR